MVRKKRPAPKPSKARPAARTTTAKRVARAGLLAALLAPLIWLAGPFTWANLWEWLKSGLIAVGLALIFRWCIGEPFKIPSGSMEPTLHGDTGFMRGDRVFVNKHVYGLRFPLHGARIPFTDTIIEYPRARLWNGADPRRWDIVVFRNVDPDSDVRVLVKRVVGLPNERIHIANGKVYVNGRAVEPPGDLRDILYYIGEHDERRVRRYILELALLEPGAGISVRGAGGGPRQVLNLAWVRNQWAGSDLDAMTRFDARERLREMSEELRVMTDREIEGLLRDLPEEQFEVATELFDLSHPRRQDNRYGVLTDDEYAVVPPGHYLVLGDNSANSRDGRVFGWLPKENILGRVACIWWPPAHWRDFTGFSRTWWWRGLMALLAFLLIWRLFLGRLWRVRPGQGGTAVADGERLFIDRLRYGLPIPFTGRRLYRGRQPRRGELVLYANPLVSADEDGPALLLGRVAALPGETVRFEDGRLTINGGAVAVHESQAARSFAATDAKAVFGRSRKPAHSVVPADHYFILSDADEPGLDSRTVCWVAHRRLVGRAAVVWWPIRRWRRIRC